MTKEKIIPLARKTVHILFTLFLLTVPCISYFLFEYVTGNLATIPSYMAALNIGWIYTLYLLVFAATGRTRIAVPAVSILLFILSLAEAFVVSFRSRPIMFWDILAFGTAMTVSQNYVFTITKSMKIAGLILLLINVAAIAFPRRISGRRFRLAFAGTAAGAIAAYGVWFFSFLMPSWGLGINMWEVNETYKEYGYILSTAVSFRYAVKEKPAGYSTSQIKRIYHEYKPEDVVLASAEDVSLGEDTAAPVNIICIMNESCLLYTSDAADE